MGTSPAGVLEKNAPLTPAIRGAPRTGMIHATRAYLSRSLGEEVGWRSVIGFDLKGGILVCTSGSRGRSVVGGSMMCGCRNGDRDKKIAGEIRNTRTSGMTWCMVALSSLLRFRGRESGSESGLAKLWPRKAAKSVVWKGSTRVMSGVGGGSRRRSTVTVREGMGAGCRSSW
jgi:hypothetical protein